MRMYALEDTRAGIVIGMPDDVDVKNGRGGHDIGA